MAPASHLCFKEEKEGGRAAFSTGDGGEESLEVDKPDEEEAVR